MPSATALYNTGRWLNASDIVDKVGMNKRIPAVVHHAEPGLIGMGADQKEQIILDLVSRQGQPWPKKLPLNKTRTMAMVSAYGDDYSLWAGKAIEVWAELTLFSGKMVPSIKIAEATNGAASPQVQAQAPTIPAAAPASYPPMQPQQVPPPSPPPSATAVAGIPAGGRPVSSIPNLSKPLEEDEIPF